MNFDGKPISFHKCASKESSIMVIYVHGMPMNVTHNTFVNYMYKLSSHRDTHIIPVIPTIECCLPHLPVD